jgi:hypothetical protein
MSIWRNEDYITHLKKNLSYEQYKRFQKISNEQFYGEVLVAQSYSNPILLLAGTVSLIF